MENTFHAVLKRCISLLRRARKAGDVYKGLYYLPHRLWVRMPKPTNPHRTRDNETLKPKPDAGKMNIQLCKNIHGERDITQRD